MRRVVAVGLVLLLAALALSRWLNAPDASPVDASASSEAGAREDPQPSLRAPVAADGPIAEPPPTPIPLDVGEHAEVLDPPEVFEEEGDLPPDPVERGPAALDLRLVDAATGAAVESHVELWRLDAPGNEHWTEGDQRQGAVRVPADGWTFTRLPVGRYRLVCSAQVRGQPAPEVEVVAPRTQLDVPIALPGTFRVRVLVTDRLGRLVPQMSLGRGSDEWLAEEAPWRFSRSLRDPSLDVLVDEAIETSLGPGVRSSEGPQSQQGFDLGLHRQADRGTRQRTVLLLESSEGAVVRVAVPALGEGEVRLVAVALPPAEFAARVRLPDGAPAPADVGVVCRAVPRDEGDRTGGWARVPIDLRARLEGYAPLDLRWSPDQGELPWIVLEPRR